MKQRYSILWKNLPDFRYLLCDLSRYGDEEIKGIISLRVAFLLLKHIFSDDLPERLPGILALMSDILDKRSGLEYLETVLRYVSSGTDRIGKERLEEVVIEVLKNQGGDIMPTIAEEWIEQGIQQGIQQGIRKGIQQGMQQGMQQVAVQAVHHTAGHRALAHRKGAIFGDGVIEEILAATPHPLVRWIGAKFSQEHNLPYR